MIESQKVSGRKRRSREEIQRLMMEAIRLRYLWHEFCDLNLILEVGAKVGEWLDT